MIIQIINTTNNFSANFYELPDFLKQFGSANTTQLYYPCHVNQTNSYLCRNLSGFFKNNAVIPTSTRGVNEDGVNFRSNHFESRIIQWQFDPVFQNIDNPLGYSPNNILNGLLLNKNDTLQVKVFTDTIFENEFFVTEETDTESGLIVLESALTNEGIYWRADKVKIVQYYFEQGQPYIIKNLPQVLLNAKVYPFNFLAFSPVETNPTYTLEHSTLGKWDSCTVTNKTNGETFTYTNSDNDTKIIIDTENLTVTNGNGDDRLSNISGTPWITLINGGNEFEWYVNDGTDYHEDKKEVPQDFSLTIEYTKYVTGIE